MDKVFKSYGEWNVTDWGIEYNPNEKSKYRGPYDIEKMFVHDEDWESHMREKNWVNMKDFMDALNYARVMFSDLIKVKDGEEKYNG